jgi:MoaA/NifB/PqqE/SkfB family radical SAM enzyme
MTAKIVSGAGYQRSELATCLPLSTPFALHIFPSNRCNLKCGYCIHSLQPDMMASIGFKKIVMDFGLFTKCIEDAGRFPNKLKVIILAGWGEPLTHPRITEMVELAKRKNVAERIEIVSNGVLLTPNLSLKLIDAGLDRIRISIQGIDSVRCRDVAGAGIDFEALVDNIRYFYTHRKQSKVFVKTVDAAVPTEPDVETFHRIFGEICDEIAIEQVVPMIREIDHTKFGSEFNKRHCGGEAIPVSVCPFPFYMSVIQADGSYTPCCSPQLPLDLGNVGETALTDLWNGRRLRIFRAAHLSGKRGRSPICGGCSRPYYDLQQGDNLDEYTERLLPLYSECTNERTIL